MKKVKINVPNLQVSAKFMIEDDEEQMKEELKEAFRIYDKEVKLKKSTEPKSVFKEGNSRNSTKGALIHLLCNQ